MNGYIKLDAMKEEDGERITADVNIHDVGIVDKVRLLHAFCTAIEIDDATILTMMMVRDDIDKSAETTKIDRSLLNAFAAFANGGEDDCEDD